MTILLECLTVLLEYRSLNITFLLPSHVHASNKLVIAVIRKPENPCI